jgi:hypothetical protein
MKKAILITMLLFSSSAFAGNVTMYQGSGGGSVIIRNTGSDNMTMTSPADLSSSGLKESGTAGENLVFGNIVYYKSDGKYWKAKAEDDTAIPCVGLSLGTINANGSGLILKAGIVRDDSWDWTVGGLLYVSPSTGGAITQTRPSTEAEIIQIIGYAISADVIYFNPDYTYVEI